MNTKNKMLAATLALVTLSLAIYMLLPDAANTGNAIDTAAASTPSNASTTFNAQAGNGPSLAETYVEGQATEVPYIAECKFDFNFETEVVSREERMDADLLAKESVIDYLGTSSNPDEMVLHAVLSTALNPESRVEELAMLVKENPQNKLASLHLLQACRKSDSTTYCNDEMVEHAMRLNESNSLMWSVVASRYMAENRVNEALLALKEIEDAPSYNDYFSLQLAYIHDASKRAMQQDPAKQSLLQYSSYNTAVRTIQLSLQSVLSEFSYDPEFCAKIDGDRYASICRDLGNIILDKGSTELAKARGRSIRDIASKKLGAELASAPLKSDAIERELDEGESTTKARELLKYDSQLSEDWIQFWINNNDESAATEFVRWKAIGLSRNPDYAPCSEYMEKYYPDAQ